MRNNRAYLSNAGDFTTFRFGDRAIRFRTSRHLRRYTSIKEWDKGYLVVMADYDTLGEVEEYIDLIPVLHNLFIDESTFLAPIEGVDIEYT